MAQHERDQSDEHPQAPWWWGLGPVGAALLVLAGIAWALWEFLGPGAADDPAAGYRGSRVVAIGLVLLGTALLQRFRSRRSPADEEADGQRD
ncbi:hypothetical protein ACFV3R_29690 [Streptomyces sp. NPDC059740]|uniref:hypothetical protein n=1 Tax=Streptomyces sp. NPDC059740 TaxID=3346926 RepID=UPI00365042C1